MKNKHIYPSLRLNEEELLQLDAQEREMRCLECGIKEVERWATEGPVAPSVSPEMLARVKRKQRPEWQGYIYKIAAGFAVLILVLQIGKQQGIVTSDDPREASHFLVDSARNDTAFLLKENLTEDTVKAVSFIMEGTEMEEGEMLEFEPLAVTGGRSEIWEQRELRVGVLQERQDRFRLKSPSHSHVRDEVEVMVLDAEEEKQLLYV